MLTASCAIEAEDAGRAAASAAKQMLQMLQQAPAAAAVTDAAAAQSTPAAAGSQDSSSCVSPGVSSSAGTAAAAAAGIGRNGSSIRASGRHKKASQAGPHPHTKQRRYLGPRLTSAQTAHLKACILAKVQENPEDYVTEVLGQMRQAYSDIYLTSHKVQMARNS